MSTDITLTLAGTSPIASATKELYFGQALPTVAVTSLTIDQTRGLLCQLGFIYSAGDYNFLGSSSGRIGKYQFDYLALQSLGLAKSAMTSNSDFRFEFNWMGMHGLPRSSSAFMSNTDLQDTLALQLAELNYESLYNSGGILLTDNIGQRSGMLAVAHYVGAEAALQWRSGTDVVTDLTADLPGIYMSGRYGTEMLPYQ